MYLFIYIQDKIIGQAVKPALCILFYIVEICIHLATSNNIIITSRMHPAQNFQSSSLYFFCVPKYLNFLTGSPNSGSKSVSNDLSYLSSFDMILFFKVTSHNKKPAGS